MEIKQNSTVITINNYYTTITNSLYSSYFIRPVKGIAGPVQRLGILQTLICAPVDGETQTMSHIIESCPLNNLNGGLSQLHSADATAIAWLTNYGS